MNIVEIIKAAMRERKMPNKVLGEKLGYKGASTVSQILSRPDLRISTIVKMLNAMDYDIVIRSRLTDKTEYKVEVEKK